MKYSIVFLSFCLATPVVAFEEKGDKRKPAQTSAQMNAEVTGFSGLIVGRLLEKDVEKGTCTVSVDHIARVPRL